MSEWTPRGYRKHHHQYENVYWCECDGRCSQGAVCDCCELADLRDEVERLTARAEAAEAERGGHTCECGYEWPQTPGGESA